MIFIIFFPNLANLNLLIVFIFKHRGNIIQKKIFMERMKTMGQMKKKADNANPSTKPAPHKPDQSVSDDLRDGHGLSKDEALKSKG